MAIAARWITTTALVATVALSISGLADYGRHARALWGTPIAERGAISILGPTGSGWAAKPGDAIDAETYAHLAALWSWTYEQQQNVGDDSDIYLNLPNLELYYFATFLWHPSRLRVDSGGMPIIGQESLDRAHFYEVNEFEALAARGYEFALVQKSGAIGLMPLAGNSSHENR
jgi:hypothetical protein